MRTGLHARYDGTALSRKKNYALHIDVQRIVPCAKKDYFCSLMGKQVTSLFLISTVMLLLFTSCRSEFERVRTSGDPALLYKKSLEYYDNQEYQRAQTLMELVISSYRGRKEAEEITFKYAYTYYHLQSYILASYYFKNFAQTYGTSPYRQEAEFMSAYSNYQLSPTYRLDQSYTKTAIDEFQLYVNTYPESDRVEECNQLIDEMRAKLERKALESGKLYYELTRYSAAINSLENTLKDYPDTDDHELIRLYIIRSAFELAENSIITKREERYEEAQQLAEEFLDRYANSSNLREVKNIREKAIVEIKNLEKNVGYQEQSTRAGS